MKVSIEFSNGKIIFQGEIFSWMNAFPKEEDLVVAIKNIETFRNIAKAAYMHPRRKIVVRKDNNIRIFPAISSKIKSKDTVSGLAFERSQLILAYIRS
jgi:hypothetical protein